MRPEPYSIIVENLAKRYTLGTRSDSTQLREHVMKLFRGSFSERRVEKHVWALRDLSFNVREGEVVGILGRNGAGKSTLLKVLSRITSPTSGRISVRGRVASLLEVGTGFHEELTGRENVFLNGSILGMRQREVKQRFDAIVSFAGVEDFIDTPIKRYSSGMRLRLGFAVAAHLEPDVLVVDEVLAVGDAAFQKKCITAMEGLRSGGRTVLFVSHNMAAVENLCSRGIWIERGTLQMDGDAREVIKAYLASYGGQCSTDSGLDFSNRTGTGEIRFTQVERLNPDGTPAEVTQCGGGVVLRIHFTATEMVRFPIFGMQLFTSMGTLVCGAGTWHQGLSIPSVEPGAGFIDVEFEMLNLLPGRYSISLWVTTDAGSAVIDGDVRLPLDIEQADVYGGGRAIDGKSGIVFFPQRWRLPQVRADGERREPGPVLKDCTS